MACEKRLYCCREDVRFLKVNKVAALLKDREPGSGGTTERCNLIGSGDAVVEPMDQQHWTIMARYWACAAIEDRTLSKKCPLLTHAPPPLVAQV